MAQCLPYYYLITRAKTSVEWKPMRESRRFKSSYITSLAPHQVTGRPRPPPHRGKEEKLDRCDCVLLSLLRAGAHCPILSSYLNRIGKAEISKCTDCEEPADSLQHALLEFPRWACWRHQTLGGFPRWRCCGRTRLQLPDTCAAADMRLFASDNRQHGERVLWIAYVRLQHCQCLVSF